MRIRSYLILLLAGLLSLAIAACAPPYDRQRAALLNEKLKESNIVQSTEQAADRLIGQCNTFLDRNEPIIVTSLVDIDDVSKSSTLGRMSSEIVANRLAQHGYQVREIKMGQDIFVSDTDSEGEFILSRDLQQIGERHNVQGFIVGTYAVGTYALGKRTRYLDTQALISLRYVDTDNIIACSYNYMVKDTDLYMWK